MHEISLKNSQMQYWGIRKWYIMVSNIIIDYAIVIDIYSIIFPSADYLFD